jgi:hypothetical protein
MKPAKQLFITCAFAAAAASALVLIETPNLGEMDKDGAKVCIIADDCTWGEQIPDEFAGTIEIKPGVTLKQFRKDIQDIIDVVDVTIRELKRDGFVVINDNPGGNLYEHLGALSALWTHEFQSRSAWRLHISLYSYRRRNR